MRPDKYRVKYLKTCIKNYRKPMDIIRRFFFYLEYRNKSHGYKKQNYVDNFYYVTTDNRLAVIKSRGHDSGKVLGEKLAKRGLINPLTHQAYVKIEGKPNTYGIKGVIVKHNRILEDLKKTIPEDDYKYYQNYFDDHESCTLTIDTDFETAYNPIYRESGVYEGDLCTSGSCMSGRGEGAQSFYGNIPCCKVVRFEDKGEQVGRCIVYEYNGIRHFIRIYGKPEYLPTLYRKLRAEMKPNDIFGRLKKIEGLKVDTTIKDDSTNMYLDGNYYGIVRLTNEDNDETIKYVMCDSAVEDQVYKDNESLNYGSDSHFDLMKSTSSDTVLSVFDDICICDCCGDRVDRDDAIYVGDEVFCSNSCARESGYEYCDWCEEWFNADDAIYVGDNCYCSDHCAHAAGYVQCEVCGEWVDRDETSGIEGAYYCICDECLDEKLSEGDLVRCDYCDEIVAVEDAKKVINKDTREEVYVCKWCADNHAEYYDKIEEGENVDKEQ